MGYALHVLCSPSALVRPNELIRAGCAKCGLPPRFVGTQFRESWVSASARKLGVCFCESLGEYDRLMDRIVQLRLEEKTIKELAAQLTREGYRTPRSQKGYTPTSVRQLLLRRGLTGGVIGREQVADEEWWLPDLAEKLGMPYHRLRDWALRGKVRARRVQPGGPWVVWADGQERRRLRKLMTNSE